MFVIENIHGHMCGVCSPPGLGDLPPTAGRTMREAPELSRQTDRQQSSEERAAGPSGHRSRGDGREGLAELPSLPVLQAGLYLQAEARGGRGLRGPDRVHWGPLRGQPCRHQPALGRIIQF